MRRFTVPSAVFLGGIFALFACSGAEQQDVLSSPSGTASSGATTSSGASGSTTSTSGSTGTSGNTSSSTTSSGDPPVNGECEQEEEDNDVPGDATPFKSSICGTLLQDNDKIDYVRFEIPVGTTSASFGYNGAVRVALTGPGAIERDFRPGESLQLLPGRWLVKIRPDGGGGDKPDGIPWQVSVSYQ